MIGTVHSTIAEIKYGEPFPKVGEERKVMNSQGVFIINYWQIGTPKWTNKLTVEIPVMVQIVNVIKLEKATKIKLSGLSLVKEEGK